MARRFGIEMEMLFDRTDAYRTIQEAGLPVENIASHIGNSEYRWVAKRDGTLMENGVDIGCEVVSPPLDFDNVENRQQVNRVVDALRWAGAKTDERAGIHIHVDASDLNARQVAAVARFFIRFEDVWYRISSSGWKTIRPGATSYAHPYSNGQKEALRRVAVEGRVNKEFAMTGDGHGEALRRAVMGRGTPDPNEKYRGCNIYSWYRKKTIEFRTFNSSLNPERIQAYIALCVNVVHDARIGKARSVGVSTPLGHMRAGLADGDTEYKKLELLLRHQGPRMSKEDVKRLRKVWKDSVPQAPMYVRPSAIDAAVVG